MTNALFFFTFDGQYKKQHYHDCDTVDVGAQAGDGGHAVGNGGRAALTDMNAVTRNVQYSAGNLPTYTTLRHCMDTSDNHLTIIRTV